MTRLGMASHSCFSASVLQKGKLFSRPAIKNQLNEREALLKCVSRAREIFLLEITVNIISHWDCFYRDLNLKLQLQQRSERRLSNKCPTIDEMSRRTTVAQCSELFSLINTNEQSTLGLFLSTFELFDWLFCCSVIGHSSWYRDMR